MTLQLKSGRTFTDKSDVIHDTGFFAVSQVFNRVGSIRLLCGIWKDSGSFTSYSTIGSPQPIITDLNVLIDGVNYISYFLIPVTISSPKAPLSVINDQFYSFLTTVKPSVPLINWDDWESA